MPDVQFQTLLTEIQLFKGDVNQRFDRVDQRLDTMDQRLTTVEVDIKEIKEKMQQIEGWTPFEANKDVIASLKAIKSKQ